MGADIRYSSMGFRFLVLASWVGTILPLIRRLHTRFLPPEPWISIHGSGGKVAGLSKVHSYSFTQLLSRFSRKTHPPDPLPEGKGGTQRRGFSGLRPEKPRLEKFPAPGGGVRGGGKCPIRWRSAKNRTLEKPCFMSQQFSICPDCRGINSPAGMKSTLKRTGEYLATGFQPVLYTSQRFLSLNKLILVLRSKASPDAAGGEPFARGHAHSSLYQCYFVKLQ